MRGRVQSFWNNGAALLLVCLGEGLSEPKGRRPRIIRCVVPQNKGVSFSLAGKLREKWGGMCPLARLIPAGGGGGERGGTSVQEGGFLELTISCKRRAFFSLTDSVTEKRVG